MGDRIIYPLMPCAQCAARAQEQEVDLTTLTQLLFLLRRKGSVQEMAEVLLAKYRLVERPS